MKCAFLVKSTISLSLVLASGLAFADSSCPDIHNMNSKTICVENHTNKSVIFTQMPDWAGSITLPAQGTATSNLAANPVWYENVQIKDKTETKLLFEAQVKACMEESSTSDDYKVGLVKNICGLNQGQEVAQAYDIALFPAF